MLHEPFVQWGEGVHGVSIWAWHAGHMTWIPAARVPTDGYSAKSKPAPSHVRSRSGYSQTRMQSVTTLTTRVVGGLNIPWGWAGLWHVSRNGRICICVLLIQLHLCFVSSYLMQVPTCSCLNIVSWESKKNGNTTWTFHVMGGGSCVEFQLANLQVTWLAVPAARSADWWLLSQIKTHTLAVRSKELLLHHTVVCEWMTSWTPRLTPHCRTV